MDVQSDVGLHCLHMFEEMFLHSTAHMENRKNFTGILIKLSQGRNKYMVMNFSGFFFIIIFPRKYGLTFHENQPFCFLFCFFFS